MMEAPEEDLKAVQAGEKSIKSVYTKIARPRKEAPSDLSPLLGKEFISTDAHGIPENITFLKSAVILLVENEKLPDRILPAQLLIEHFLKKNERKGFYKLLPEKVREWLMLYQ
jgi:hypothetical protein